MESTLSISLSVNFLKCSHSRRHVDRGVAPGVRDESHSVRATEVSLSQRQKVCFTQASSLRAAHRWEPKPPSIRGGRGKDAWPFAPCAHRDGCCGGTCGSAAAPWARGHWPSAAAPLLLYPVTPAPSCHRRNTRTGSKGCDPNVPSTP